MMTTVIDHERRMQRQARLMERLQDPMRAEQVTSLLLAHYGQPGFEHLMARLHPHLTVETVAALKQEVDAHPANFTFSNPSLITWALPDSLPNGQHVWIFVFFLPGGGHGV